MEANDDEFQDAVDDFQDAVEDAGEQKYEDGPDESKIYTDKDGNVVQLPKEWHFDNSFNFESEDLKDIFQGVEPGNCRLSEEMLKIPPAEPFIQFGKAKPVRLIFYPPDQVGAWKYTQEEITAIQKFKEFCKKKGRNIPDCDGEILRWFYACKFDNQKTLAAIDFRFQLTKNSLPIMITKNTFDLINNGFIHVCGRDRLYRPVIVVKFRVLIDIKPMPHPNEVIAAAALNLFFVYKYMLKKGQIENLIQVMDCSGVGVGSIPYSMIKTGLGFMTNMNKGRAKTIFALNSPSVISILWGVVRHFLDENTQKKVQFSNSNTCSELLRLVQPDMLEKKYGGNAPDRQPGQYWPPYLNSENFDYGQMGDAATTNSEMLKMSVLSQTQDDRTEEQVAAEFQKMQEDLKNKE